MRVGVDIDGVLANFNASYIERCITVTGKDLFPPRPFDILTWNYPESYGYTNEEVSSVWEDIKSDGYFWEDLLAYPNTAEALRRLDTEELAGSEIYYITARPGIYVKHQTEIWLQKQFPVHGVSTVLISSHKGLCAAALKLDRYIDDKPENVLETSLHCRTYLMNRPWNAYFDTNQPYVHPIIRVNSVEEMLND